MMIKVSIVVPIFNTEKYIEKCLKSLVNQTLQEIEIICVNDGSTDRSMEIVEQFAVKDNRIKILNQPNLKQGAARNNGTKVAQGEYIGYVDSDDWVDIDYFEKLYEAAKKYDSDLALATNVRIGNGKTKKRLELTREEYIVDLQGKMDVCRQWKDGCPTNKLYRRGFLQEKAISFEEGVGCEDKLFTTQAVYYANGIVTVPNIYYYYFRNPDSTVKTCRRFWIKNDDKENARRSVLKFLKEHNAPLRDKDFWAVKHELRFLGVPLFTIKESLQTQKLLLCGVNIFEKTYLDYKRNLITSFGVKIKCKRKDWLKEANSLNNKLNLKNFEISYKQDNKNIMFVSSIFVTSGGIESRLLQYVDILKKNGWHVFLLSEENSNKELQKLSNFHLNFDATNFNNCLNELIDLYNINVIEFQFKNPKILRNLDLKELKTKVKLGCTIHNDGIKQVNLINQLDYKVLVSEQMYSRHYKNIQNPTIIRNAIAVSEDRAKWTYKNQPKALLISRIAKDKLDSIVCFIKYCQEKGLDFDIAGNGQQGTKITKNLIERFKLSDSHFIGEIDTISYLHKNIEKYLFVAGVGQVILEAGSLGYPCFCCSEYNDKNYSFVTKDNFELFDNFTIKSYHKIAKLNKKKYVLDIRDLDIYNISENIILSRDITNISSKYEQLLGEGLC